jgi:RHS repeat-associated protein
MKKLFYILSFIPILALAQSQDQNYVKTTIYKKPTSVSSVDPILPENAVIQVSYFDGLGRPIQQVAHKQSNTGKDIITPIEYDGFGRQVKDYLPYVPTSVASQNFRPDALTATGVLGYSSYSGQNPFSEKVLEASPLNRIMKQASPGSLSSWAKDSGHEIKFEYKTNTASDGVRKFVVKTSWVPSKELFEFTLTSLTSTAYPDNQLFKTITYDENTAANPIETNGSTVEFKDKEGRVILKRVYGSSVIGTSEQYTTHDTYYVYDQFGNLTFVIPPLVNAASTISTTILNDLCYQYKYDYRNRLVEKKLPGKQWEFIVYDRLDRVIATGPALAPFTNLQTIPPTAPNVGWMITKYDRFNRPVLTGWMSATDVTSAGRKTLQYNRSLDTNISETKTASTVISTVNNISFNYSNVAFPANTTTAYHVLTINYYDDYDTNLTATFSPIINYTPSTNLPIYYNNTAGTKPKGLPTISWVRFVESTNLYNAEKSYTLYDKKARAIRTSMNNYLGGFTQVDNQMEEITGRVNYTITTHKRAAGDQPITVRDNFAYTDQDRLLRTTQIITKPDGAVMPEQLIAENTYDELGQLIIKKVGDTTNNPLQTINYDYNIRGWLTGINNDANNNLVLNTTQNDLFAFKINYNTVQNESGYIGEPLYNGNISETYWRTSGDNQLRKYGYFYDDLNRLKSAVYQRPGTTAPVTNMYNESLTYDKNGNIRTLKRNGDFDAQSLPIPIDDLTYQYGTDGTDQYASNRLRWVKENSNNNGALGFKNGTNANNNITTPTEFDYTYDANGNMLSDRNKAITSIKYNHLNLPTEIFFTATKKVNYLYTATGQKLKKIVTNGSIVTTTDYLGGFQYMKAGTSSPIVLQYFPHPEGYVNFDTGVYKYVFNYTDHLGNIRVSYTKDETTGLPVRLEQNHYYPFGLKHTNYNTEIMKLRGPGPIASVTNPYKYKYNGKELQDELGLNWYDYQARNYDPALGRWMNVDPLAEKFPNMSPYNFCMNNPIYFIDPDGMAAVPGDDTYIYKDAQGKVTKTEVINTGTDTPNRLFIQDASATKDTENRKEHNGSFFQIEMIPSNQYTESDYKSEFFGSSQFDKDRNAYITNGGDYSDKNYLQRLGTSLADDPVTISDLTILLMPRSNAKSPGSALGAEEKAIQYTYAPRVRARGVEDPVSHNFPYSFDKHILQTPAIPQKNGYNIYQLPGSMNGKNGVFEIGVNSKNVIDHRFFRPTR